MTQRISAPFAACLLVGGRAVRLGEACANAPKCLLPIHGRPFLDLVVRKLTHEGGSQVILATGHEAERVERHIAESPDLSGVSTFKETGGTGPAVLKAMSIRRLFPDLLVINGDTILDVDYGTVVQHHRASGAAVT